MRGSPVVDRQAKLFMTLTKNLPTATAVAKAAFSRAAGTRLKADPESIARVNPSLTAYEEISPFSSHP